MDRLMLGLSTTAIGILVVFFGLVILIGCIYVMTLFTRGRDKKPAPAPMPKAVPVPAPAPVEEAAAEAEDDSTLIAVISAGCKAAPPAPAPPGTNRFSATCKYRREISNHA